MKLPYFTLTEIYDLVIKEAATAAYYYFYYYLHKLKMKHDSKEYESYQPICIQAFFLTLEKHWRPENLRFGRNFLKTQENDKKTHAKI